MAGAVEASWDETFAMGLQLVLHHTALRKCRRSASSLMRVSSGAAAAVASACAGAQELALSLETLQDEDKPGPISAWLAKHAGLLSCLDMDEADLWTDKADAAAAAGAGKVAAALQAAAAQHPGALRLRSLTTFSLPVVRAASCSTALTALHLQLPGSLLMPSMQDAAACIAALGSQLLSLELTAAHRYFYGLSADETGWRSWQNFSNTNLEPAADRGFSALLRCALPQLTRLRSLEVGDLADACVLQHAPPQLEELTAMSADDKSTGDLRLGHLTACTSLALLRNPEYEAEGWRVLMEKDELPPNLRSLQAADCWSVSPLLPLKSLRSLAIMPQCYTASDELQRLSVLTDLEHCLLGYSRLRGGGMEDGPDRAAIAWESVPALCELVLDEVFLNSRLGALCFLAGLTSLTKLTWGSVSVERFTDAAPPEADEEESNPFDFQDNVRMLHALAYALPDSLLELELGCGFMPYAEAPGDEDRVLGACHDLMRAIACLPRLRRLTIQRSQDANLSEEGEAEMHALFDRALAAVRDGIFDFGFDWSTDEDEDEDEGEQDGGDGGGEDEDDS